MIDRREVIGPFERTVAETGEWQSLMEICDTEGLPMAYIVGGFRNDLEKHHLMAAAGTLAGALEADMIRFISDTWHARPDEDGVVRVRPSDDPQAQEAVMVVEVKRAGMETMLLFYERGPEDQIIWTDGPDELKDQDGKTFESPIADMLRFGLTMTAPSIPTAKEMVKSLLKQKYTVSIKNELLGLPDGEELT